MSNICFEIYMQLTQFTDYSLRALIYIASKESKCTINDIANAYRISDNHLIKIIHNLSKLGLIHTTRGKSGGITLAVDPAEVNLGTLIQQLESHFDLVPCFNPAKANCCIAPACKLKLMLHEAQNAFMNVLKKYSLANILENPLDLRRLLGILKES